MKHREIVVSSPRAVRVDGGTRVTAMVDGVPLWFESDEVNLSAAPEAFASALLLTSQHRRQRLVIDGALDPVWTANIARVLAKWETWWGYKPILPQGDTREPAQRSRTAALCFSGGERRVLAAADRLVKRSHATLRFREWKNRLRYIADQYV